MEIDIMKYITDEQIGEIVADAVRDKVRDASSESLSTMISNAAYTIVWEMVNEQFNDKLENMLKNKVVEIINNMSSFNVFRWKSYYSDKNSRGADIVDETINGMRNEIVKKVRKEFDDFKFTKKIKNEIAEIMCENLKRPNNYNF